LHTALKVERSAELRSPQALALGGRVEKNMTARENSYLNHLRITQLSEVHALTLKDLSWAPD